MSLLGEFYSPFIDLPPCMVGLEDCGSPFNRLKGKKKGAEKYLVKHFLSGQQSSEGGNRSGEPDGWFGRGLK